MAPRLKLVYFVVATAGVSAFRLPTSRLVRVEHAPCIRTTSHASSVVVSLSREHEDEELPFFARALQKLRKPKKEDSEMGIAVLEKRDTEETIVIVDSEAATLRAQSEKMRLEADKMDMLLTLAKIGKLEEKITDTDEHSNILREAQLLMKKVDPLAHEKTTVERALSTDSLSNGKDSNLSDNAQKSGKNIVKEILDGGKPLLSEEKREDAIDAFDKLPRPLKDMMAKTVGMQNGSNATAAIDMLMAENKLYEGDNEERFSMIAQTDDLEDMFLDLENVEIDKFISNMLPKSTRKALVKEEYIDALYSEGVLGKDTFNPKERKPQAVPGGYLIRGLSKIRPKDGEDEGDVLIQALDRKISASSVAGKIQCYYIRDPTPPSGEEIMNDEDETPLLFITGYDISPDTNFLVKPGITVVGLATTVAFALVSTSLNPAVQQTLASTELDSYDFLYDLSLPLALSLIILQLVREAGHSLISVKDGIRIGFPTLVPSFQLGLTGTITPIKTSPKNIKSLFDFAITGPLFGLAASLILLYSGLETTVMMETSAQAQLPSVPVEILRSSTLGGGIIDFLLGGVLNAPGGSVINLHWMAIAGFAGLMSNALSLVPIGNTDGGRMSLAFFGRSSSRALQVVAIVILVIANFFGGDPSNILLCYAGFTQTWQGEPEVPCRNEIDELDLVRGFLAIGMWTFATLTLVPMSV